MTRAKGKQIMKQLAAKHNKRNQAAQQPTRRFDNFCDDCGKPATRSEWQGDDSPTRCKECYIDSNVCACLFLGTVTDIVERLGVPMKLDEAGVLASIARLNVKYNKEGGNITVTDGTITFGKVQQ